MNSRDTGVGTSETASESSRDFAIATALALAVLGLAIRVYGLGRWDIIYDEYFTFVHAAERWRGIVNPAYYGLVAICYRLFGVSELSARLPALIMGVVSIPVFYWTWRSIIGNRAAVYGTLLIVFSVWHVWYSQYSRFYSGVFLFGSLTYYFYFSALIRDSMRDLAWSLAMAVIATSFHATAILAPAACAAFSVVAAASGRLGSRAYSSRIVRLHLMLSMLGLAAAIPLTLWHFDQWQGKLQFWGYAPLGASLQLVKWLQLPIAICALIGLLDLLIWRRGLGLFLTVTLGVSVSAYIAGSTLTTVRPEYIFASMPLAFVAAGSLCERVHAAAMQRNTGSGALSRLRDQRLAAGIVSYAMIIVVIISLMPDFVSYFAGRSTLHMRQPASFVDRVYEHGDRVLPLVNLFNSFHYYADKNYPEEPQLGDPLDPNLDWRTSMDPYRSMANCVWIVLPIRRQALAGSLERWLIENARLVWRTTSTRFDYKVEGYQIFVAGLAADRCVQKVVDNGFLYGDPAVHD